MSEHLQVDLAFIRQPQPAPASCLQRRLAYARKECDKNVYRSSPRLAGANKVLSTVPTVDWVMLGSGGFDKG